MKYIALSRLYACSAAHAAKVAVKSEPFAVRPTDHSPLNYSMTLRLLKIVFPVLLSIFDTQVRADTLPTMSIRYMTIDADVIVVGDPVVSEAGILPARYKVVRVLKGPASLASQELVVRDEELYSLSPSPWMEEGKEKTPLPRITKALLFLKSPAEGRVDEGYGTVLSGIRALSNDGVVLVPRQLMNPGLQHLVPMKDRGWEAMITQVTEDLPKIARILKLEKITDSAKRNQAVFKWIEGHKDEFGGGYLDNQRKGWPHLETKLFDRVMESCIPEDCWRAIELGNKLDAKPDGNFPSFCSPQGRKLLMTKVFDRNLPMPLRQIALGELGDGGTFWYAHRNQFPRTQVVTRDEQTAVIDRILPLLKYKDATWRAAAVRCLRSVSCPYDAIFTEMKSKQAIPQLAELYNHERSAEVRNEIVEAIRRLESEVFWENLTGNPQGIAVIMRVGTIKEDALEFQMILEHTKAKIAGVPVFLLELLDGAGQPLRAQSFGADVSYPTDLFKTGWEDWQGMVIMSIAAPHLEPGTWRATAKGRVGEKVWRSESIEVVIPKPGDH